MLQKTEIQNKFPILYYDTNETLLPLKIGYTLYSAKEFCDYFTSNTFSRTLFFMKELTGLNEDTAHIIEYSLWYDCDIEHLWELEHLWIYLDKKLNTIKLEGSRHANIVELDIDKKIYIEPGKHGHFQGPVTPRLKALSTHICTHPGNNKLDFGVIKAPDFAEFRDTLEKTHRSRDLQNKAQEYITKYRFTPSFTFDKKFAPPNSMLLPWKTFKEYVENYLKNQLATLR